MSILPYFRHKDYPEATLEFFDFAYKTDTNVQHVTNL